MGLADGPTLLLIDHMSQYWDSQAAPLNNGLRNLGAGLARLPMYQARAGLYGAQADKANADTDEATARTGLVGAQTETEKAKAADINQKLNLVQALQNITPVATDALMKGDLQDPAIGQYTGALAALTGHNEGDVQKTMAGNLGMLLARGGNVQGAANVVNPVAVANNAADNATTAARPLIVPSGATAMTPSGQPLGTGGVTLNPGQQRFAPQGNLAAALPAEQDADPAEQDADFSPGSVAAAGAPGATAPAQPIASVPPLPPKPGAAGKPQTLPPGVLNAAFKQYLANSSRGTNADEALAKVNALIGKGGANPAAEPKGPVVNSQEEYDALPPWANYVDSYGRAAVKRGK